MGPRVRRDATGGDDGGGGGDDGDDHDPDDGDYNGEDAGLVMMVPMTTTIKNTK